MTHLPAGRRLFSFVVVADTHVNEHEDRSLSPFRTNALANGRARYVMHEIAALDPAPAFVVHLGDMVHPVPSLPAYGEAAARYKAITEVLRVPVHRAMEMQPRRPIREAAAPAQHGALTATAPAAAGLARPSRCPLISNRRRCRSR